MITFPKAELLTSAILNLLLNAIQAAGEGGAVELRTCRDEPAWIKIEITDNGPGPSVAVESKMFEPLVSTKREGVGLGLALVAMPLSNLAVKLIGVVKTV